MPEVGHNQPPSQKDLCLGVARDINNWLAEHPAISTEEDARQAKMLLDRGKLGLQDLEDERTSAVKPLNDRVKEINDSYRPTKTVVGAIISEIAKRIATYIEAEEEKRQEAVREAARRAAEAESRARESERREQQAADQASTGELGVDLATAVSEGDAARRELEKAEREVARAERETHVKVGGGFSRATSLRKVKVFNLYGDSPTVAALRVLRAVGVTDDIRDALIKAAKAYYEEYGELPPGIIMHEERKV